MHFRSQFLATVAMFSLVLGFVPTTIVRAAAGTSISAGDLIRGETFSAVYYYGEDGFRYVFPNDKTYFTWYENFDDVKMISDAELATIQMGGNVTYQPGPKMVKINSDPKVYALGMYGTLYWVSSEEAALEFYGEDWQSDIDDIPDAFFGNYTQTGEVFTLLIAAEVAAYRSLPGLFTISFDKGLSDYTEIVIKNNEFTRTDLADSSTITIDAGQTVLWRNDDSVNHTATADDGSWGTGTIKPDGWFVRRFDEPGTYTYFCSYHPEMTGTVIVEEVLTM